MIANSEHEPHAAPGKAKPQKRAFRRYLPYVASVVGALVGYFGTRQFNTGTLADVMAVVGAGVGYVLCRAVQTRGRIPLGVTAIGLPLIAAILCGAALQLTPYRKRQRAISALRAANFDIQMGPPVVKNEWLIDSAGNSLPMWLADLLGRECMSEVTSISGELEAMQGFNLSLIDRKSLRYVKLRRKRLEGPPLSQELVDWLNGCVAIREKYGLTFTFAGYQTEDSQALQQLSHEFSLELLACHEIHDLSGLPRMQSLRLSGQALSVELAEQLTAVEGIEDLYLSIPGLSSELIDALAPLNPSCNLSIVGAAMDVDALNSLAKLGRVEIRLWACKFRELEKLLSFESAGRTRTSSQARPIGTLQLGNFSLSYGECKRVAWLLQCETLKLNEVRIPKSNSDPMEIGGVSSPFLDVDSPDIEAFWSLEHLQRIQSNDGGQSWKTIERPSKHKSL